MTAPQSYRATFQEDLAKLYARLQPKSVGCFDLAELSVIPLDQLVRTGSDAWFVDGNAGRVKKLLAGEVARANSRAACLACESAIAGEDVCSSYIPKLTNGACCGSREALPRDPTRCTQFVPGRRLHVVNGDTRRGREAAFATRVEMVIAAAATPMAAVDEALEVCRRSAELDFPLPLQDGTLDLVISLLAPARLMEQPYAFFEELLRRRFGVRLSDELAELVNQLEQLRVALFRTQLEAHVRELSRLTHPRHGRLYFATVPEPAIDGAWPFDHAVADCLGALAQHFDFDFETFPPEAFLRRSLTDRAIVLQAALLRPRPPRSTR